MPGAGSSRKARALWIHVASALALCIVPMHCSSEPSVEDNEETCSSGVAWSGVEINSDLGTLRVDACVEDFCAQRVIRLEQGDTCGVKIEATDSVRSSACAYSIAGIAHLVLYLDLTRVAAELDEGDEAVLEVSSPDGQVLLRHSSTLSYVGSTNGTAPCRTAEVHVVDTDAGT